MKLEHFENKIILITGAAGTIGSELTKAIIKSSPKKLIVLDQAEAALHYLKIDLQMNNSNLNALSFILGSITDDTLLKHIFLEHKIDYVFHSVAYKRVPILEKNPVSGIRVNIFGTKKLLELASSNNVSHFILFSTDKAVEPSSVMGCTKAVCEKLISFYSKNKSSKTKYAIIRFGNIYGSNGSVVPIFKQQIQSGGPVTVTHKDASRYFIKLKKAIELICKSVQITKGGEVFIFKMNHSVNILKLAQEMIEEYGAESQKIKIDFTGLREGEKLHELLNRKNALVKQTVFSEISELKNFYDDSSDNVIVELEELKDTLDSYNEIDIVKKLKQIIKDFKSKNSPYEILDNQC